MKIKTSQIGPSVGQFLPVLWTPTHPLRTVCWVICHYGTSVIDLVVECLEAGSIKAPQTAYDHVLEFLKQNHRSTPTLRIFRIFFPQGSSWLEPLFVPSADPSMSSRAGDGPFAKYSPAFLTSAFLAPFFLKPEKISSSSPIRFGNTHQRESCVDPVAAIVLWAFFSCSFTSRIIRRHKLSYVRAWNKRLMSTERP
jgi:hypothetical protein